MSNIDLHQPGSRCTHYETRTDPGDCEECVCGDCGTWVGSREIAANGGVCEQCLDQGMKDLEATE